MNILNKGRCSRCIASEQKRKIIKSEVILGVEVSESRTWKWCNKHNNWCRYISRNCKESPMGVKI